jgi:glycosyltransferase involved in cell wall biosynthesis
MISKIGILTTAHDALDIRIFYKECRSLAEAGYQVYLIANHDKEETVDGVRIIPISTGRSRIYRFLIKGWEVLWKAIKLKAGVYHFHDPDLIPYGLILKLLGKKVIYDVHEDVPKDILGKEWLGNIRLRKVVSSLFGLFMKLSTLFFDRIIAATPSISKRFPKNKTTVIGNVPIIALIDKPMVETVTKTRIAVVYAGALTKIRGIMEIIEAIGILDNMVELWLLGWWDDSEYEQKCKSLDGWRYVRYFGVMTLENTYSIMKQADIGIINDFPVPNYIESHPNKAYEYMTCRLPIVMSDFVYWKDIFGECAVFVNPMDPKDIAEKIKNLVVNPEYRKKLAWEGRRLIENKYSWESESKNLIGLYKNLLNNNGGNLSETDDGAGK